MEAIIFIGIQGAGKSSFYGERFFNTHIRINLDMLKTRHRERILLKACLEAKQPFVVDNTNASIEVRAKYIELAKAAQFRITGYYFCSSLADALRRNSLRAGKERIPEEGIIATYRRLKPPSLTEGFDELYHVNINAANEFVVAQVWRSSEKRGL